METKRLSAPGTSFASLAAMHVSKLAVMPSLVVIGVGVYGFMIWTGVMSLTSSFNIAWPDGWLG